LADSVALVIALSATYAEPEGVSVALSAHATALLGPLPDLAWGAGGAIALEGFGAFRLELSSSAYLEQSHTYAHTNVGARFNSLRFGARVCRIWHFGPFDLAPCVGAQVYRIRGVGFGGTKYSDGTSYVWGPAIGLFNRLRLFSVFAVVLSADATVPIERQRFVYTDVGSLHRPAAVAFQLFIAPEVRF
jgi:hypothetical protein